MIGKSCIEGIFILEGILGGIAAFHEVGSFSMISSSAKESYRNFIYGVMEICSSVISFLAPLFMGLWGKTWPVAWFCLGCAGSSIFFCLALGRIALPTSLQSKDDRPPRRQIISEVFSHVPLRRLLIYFITLNLCNGFVAGLLNAYVLGRCGGCFKGLSTFGTCLALGTFGGSLLAPKVGQRFTLWPLMLWAGALSALGGRILFGCSLTFAGVCLWGTLRALLAPLINTANQILWTQYSTPQKRGRFLGTRRLLSQGGYPLAIGMGGWLCFLYPSFCDNNLGGLIILAGCVELLMIAFLAYQEFKTRRHRSTVMGRLSLKLASLRSDTIR